MKNAFYFMLKALLFLRYLHFSLFGYIDQLDKTAMVNLKIYDVTGWTIDITIQILPNFPKSKSK